MTQSVIGAVNNARELFQIEDFPGNLFSLLESQRYIERFSLLLFREDISKLSGFIGYGENGLSLICINYKRPIGHQNFTWPMNWDIGSCTMAKAFLITWTTS